MDMDQVSVGGMPPLLIIDATRDRSLIRRRYQEEMDVFTVRLSSDEAASYLEEKPSLSGIILAGNDRSIYGDDAPDLPEEVLRIPVPVLFTGSYFRWFVRREGGMVIKERKKWRGEMDVLFYWDRLDSLGLFHGINEFETVLMDHWDTIPASLPSYEHLPREFKPRSLLPAGSKMIANTIDRREIVASLDKEKRRWGVMFQPEAPGVYEQVGRKILSNFARICGFNTSRRGEDDLLPLNAETHVASSPAA